MLQYDIFALGLEPALPEMYSVELGDYAQFSFSLHRMLKAFEVFIHRRDATSAGKCGPGVGTSNGCRWMCRLLVLEASRLTGSIHVTCFPYLPARNWDSELYPKRIQCLKLRWSSKYCVLICSPRGTSLFSTALDSYMMRESVFEVSSFWTYEAYARTRLLLLRL
jgi:hypothetical protein